MTTNGRNLLLLLMGDEPPPRLRDAVGRRTPPPARVHLVAPALVSPLDWLASAEDDAYRQAEVRALDAEWTLADQTEVEAEAGDVDPVQAVEDALRAFPADEILLAGEEADPDLEAALGRFGIPITRLDPAPFARRSSGYRALRELAGGHRSATPFVLFVGVNTAFLLLGVLLSLLALLVLWLSGNL